MYKILIIATYRSTVLKSTGVMRPGQTRTCEVRRVATIKIEKNYTKNYLGNSMNPIFVVEFHMTRISIIETMQLKWL